MTTKKESILEQLQKCIELINMLKNRNMLKNIFDDALIKYSVKFLSLQKIKPSFVILYMKKRYLNVKMLKDQDFEGFQSNAKDQWGFSQYKVFAWICICDAYSKNKTIKMFNDEDIKFLNLIFYRKSQQFIRFNIRRLLSSNKFHTKWNQQDEKLLLNIIGSKESVQSWSQISFQMFIQSNKILFFQPHHCRERWLNHLDPQVNKQKWSPEENLKLIRGIIQNGKIWSFISCSIFKGSRTEHMVKNRYNSIIKKHFRKGCKVDLTKLVQKQGQFYCLKDQISIQEQTNERQSTTLQLASDSINYLTQIRQQRRQQIGQQRRQQIRDQTQQNEGEQESNNFQIEIDNLTNKQLQQANLKYNLTKEEDQYLTLLLL